MSIRKFWTLVLAYASVAIWTYNVVLILEELL